MKPETQLYMIQVYTLANNGLLFIGVLSYT